MHTIEHYVSDPMLNSLLTSFYYLQPPSLISNYYYSYCTQKLTKELSDLPKGHPDIKCYYQNLKIDASKAHETANKL